jgi:hypothetical protein
MGNHLIKKRTMTYRNFRRAASDRYARGLSEGGSLRTAASAGAMLRRSVTPKDREVLLGKRKATAARMRHLRELLLIDEDGEVTTLGRAICGEETVQRVTEELPAPTWPPIRRRSG